MGIRRGSITTRIITDGLVLNLDAANRASYPKVGTVWNDTINGNNGTLTNGPTFDSDNGGSIVFDGVNDYSNISSTIDFSTYTNGFTIGFWVKILNISQTNRYLFSKRRNDGNDNQFSVIYGYVGSTFELYSSALGGANQVIRTGSQILVNNTDWHFLYYTVGTTTTGYLDGVVKFVNTYPTLTFTPSTNNNLIATFNASGFYGNLSLSSMVLYNRALSSQEVLHNYNALKGRFGL